MDVILLKIQDKTKINGETQIKDHSNEIEVLSFSHGVAMQITGDQSNTARTSGKPNHQDFTVTKYVDSATAPLIDACNKGTSLGAITVLIGRNDSGSVIPFIQYDLNDALVSSVSVGGGGGGKPQETVTFNYSGIKWTYTVQGEDVTKKGNVAASWSLATNQPLS